MEVSPLFVHSLQKGVQVLECFSRGEQYLSLKEIVALSGLEKSATQRCVHTLMQLGYLEKCSRTRRFSLGKKCLDLSFNFLRTHPLVEAATPTLVELRRACGERVNLSLFDGVTLVYVIRQQGKREYFYSSLIGRRMPTFCTSGGRAALSQLPREEMMELVAASDLTPLTNETITDPERIHAEIDLARMRGYGFVVGESTIGELAVGAAILDSDMRPIGAVHIAGGLGEWNPVDYEKRFAPLVVESARSLSRNVSVAARRDLA